MAESTLSVSYLDLEIAIAHYLGFSLTKTDWTTKQQAVITMALKAGLRQFYNPPAVYENEPPHQWSFLRPVASVTTVAPYSTGTVAIANGETTVTLTDGVFPSWAATNGTLIIGTTECAIAVRDGDTQLTLSSSFTGTTETAATYTLRHNGIFDMDDDFGGIDGHVLVHGDGVNKPDVKVVSDSFVRRERQLSSRTGVPLYAATRPKNTTVTASAGQRFEMIVYPIPDAAYTLYFTKSVLVGVPDDTHIYPLGGAAFGDCILKSCLAAAETQEDGTRGVKWDDFMAAMTSAIRTDRTANAPAYLGYNGDSSDRLHRPYGRLKRADGDFIVTYNGNY